MKTAPRPILITLAALALAGGVCLNLFAQGTAFTYQGRLNGSGGPATGVYDLHFSLYTVASGGSAVAGPLPVTGVSVSNGLFTATLDFGTNLFNGTQYWLELAVATNGGGSFDTLSPRQSVTPSPYAEYAAGAASATIASAVAGTNITGGVPDTALSANVALRGGGNTYTGNQNFTGAGIITLDNAEDIYAKNTSGVVEGLLTGRWTDNATYLTYGAGGLIVRNRTDGLAMFINNGGNVGIGTNNPAAALHVVGNILATGTITGSSDRNVKENFATVDPAEVLDKVAALPISRWNYKADREERHLGPMAQDFYSAFGLGMDDKHISMVDADGVALAAIQGLNEKVESGKQKTENQVQQLEQRLEQKDKEMTELKSELSDLKQLVRSLNQKLNENGH